MSHGYALRTSHPTEFSAFEPDLLGALREAYAFITQPTISKRGYVEYDIRRHGDLVEMMGKAIRKAQGGKL